jgi:hypothetical protein
MPAASPNNVQTDPLAIFMHRAEREHGEYPLPQVSSRYEVALDSGLAVVTATRIFRNDEPRSIEATITFPMPVRAVLFGMEAKIDGRILKAVAMERGNSRETYEQAIERGKTAVLHEELLPGIHMLSVGPLSSGAEIAVTMNWATTLTLIEGAGHLRIPLTVGDVYGQSALPDSDELIHGGPVQPVQVRVQCDSGSVEISGRTLVGGRTEVQSNAPIDIVARGWSSRTLVGRTANGRNVSLRIEPRNSGTAPLDLAILVDHSASMAETAGLSSGLTKHQAVVGGLNELAHGLADDDRVQLIEFSNVPNAISPKVALFMRLRTGSARIGSRDRLGAAIKSLSPPEGGTEIGAAVAYALQAPETRDILLITDGKSHALDVQALAQYGKRISVVLVGEDSLEANIGRLALLSGGDLFVARDLAGAILSAVNALRSPFGRSARQGSEMETVATISGNMVVTAQWSTAEQESDAPQIARAVSAVATFLALPGLNRETATTTAKEEGLVTHLTSLILVDEESRTEDGLPNTRKIPLAMPREELSPAFLLPQASRVLEQAPRKLSRSSDALFEKPSFLRRIDKPASAQPSHIRSEQRVDQIDWDAAPNELAEGNLSSLEPDVRDEVQRLAQSGKVLVISRMLRTDPIRIVIATMALAAASRSRSAERIARNILGPSARLEFDDIASALMDIVRL